MAQFAHNQQNNSKRVLTYRTNAAKHPDLFIFSGLTSAVTAIFATVLRSRMPKSAEKNISNCYFLQMDLEHECQNLQKKGPIMGTT